MSTQVAPSISPLPTTPAGEWADSTKTALGEQHDHIQPPLQHTLSTPGPELPGAYPRTAEDAKPVDTSAFNPHNVLNTAKQYLPQAVTSYFDGEKPQNEPQNEVATPQGEPANELATPQNEPRNEITIPQDEHRSEIAIPQNEHQNEIAIPQNEHPNEIIIPQYQNEIAIPQNEYQNEIATPQNELMNEVATPQNDDSIPISLSNKEDSTITEPESVANLSTRAVVGSSVGSSASAAVVSEISEYHAPDSTSTIGTNKAVVDSPKPTSVASTDGMKMQNASTIAEQGHGIPNPTPPAALENSFLPMDKGSKFQESTPTAPSNTSSGSGSNQSASSSPTRSRFMDKIKGEAKVISGKLSKNEEKIEQGRKLLGKS